MRSGSVQKHVKAAVFAMVILTSAIAHAQHVQLLTQTHTQNSGLVLDGTDTLAPGKLELSVGLNYSRRPVIETINENTDPVYGGLLTPKVVLSYGFSDRLQLSFSMPWHRITADSPDTQEMTTAFGFETRWRLRSAIQGRGLSSALVIGIHAALEDAANLVSAGGAVLYGRQILQYGFELAVLRLSVGYEHDTSAATAVRSLAGGAHAVTYGGGLQIGRVNAGMHGFTEIYAKRLLPRGYFELDEHSAEAVAGIRVRSDRGVAMALSGGRGFTDGFGASALRVMLQLNWMIDADKPFGFGRSAIADPDGDGVVHPFDQCPNTVEDRDGYRDGDGCPDTDNDGDGFTDQNDRCPDQAEDLDGFEDNDGCPDVDNDGDGVLDINDSCPNDGQSTTEKIHPNGCPLIQIHGQRLTIATPIRFASGSDILPDDATQILRAIVRFMQTRPKADRLRVEGYTDLWGGLKYNVSLAKRRAMAVKNRLIGLGLVGSRIEAFGRGTEAPIGDGKAPDDAKQSRRVEFYLSLSERNANSQE